MARYRYRAMTTTGLARSGIIDQPQPADALAELRRQGLMPIELAPAANDSSPATSSKRPGRGTAEAVTKALSELAVLLQAGLTLDRALVIVPDNIEHPATRLAFENLYKAVKEGVPLSRAMAADPAFSTLASAMTEAGEANGRLGDAIAGLAATLERAQQLRQTLASALMYPIILLVFAVAIILIMLMFVLPQFESAFAQAKGQLPFASRAVMAASHALRDYGLVMLALAVGAGIGVSRWLAQPAMRRRFDRAILSVPMVGLLVRHVETARFARVLGALLEGGVALPVAMGIASRGIGNQHIAEAVAAVTAGLKQGEGLAGPLAQSKVFPRLAIGFLRTGEETSQLALMATRLADVLDREVRLRLDGLMAILTPAITIGLGGMVALVIAAILSAILGFNDVALAS